MTPESSSNRGSVFADPLFVASVIVLLVNDWFLKSLFHNFLTGKLSDVAGVLAVGMLAAALAPRQRVAALSLVALGFTFWKLPLSTPLLAFFHQQFGRAPFRVIDVTDLLALLVLPVALVYRPRARLASPLPLAIASLVAFTATSQIQHRVSLSTTQDPRRYFTALTEKQVVERLQRCGAQPYLSRYEHRTSITFNLRLTGAVQIRTVRAYAVLEPESSGTVLSIRSVSVPGRTSPYTDEQIRSAFSEALQNCMREGA